MRIIKFRGKCVPDSKYAGEWVEGGYAPLDEISSCKNKGEGLIVVFLGGNCSCSYHVIAETVGEFTGLSDKNGNEIYEGDILRFPAKDEWEKENFVSYEVFWHDNDCAANHIGWQMNRLHFQGSLCGADIGIITFLPKWTSKMEIIGNIHDNPELLKGGKDEDS